MKEQIIKKRFTESQIIGILKEADLFSPEEVSRKHGVHRNTIYNRRSEYGRLTVLDLQQLKYFSEENRRLKRLVVDLSLGNQILKDVNPKNW